MVAVLPASATVEGRAAIAVTLRADAAAVRVGRAAVGAPVDPVVVADPVADVAPVVPAVVVAVREVLAVGRAVPAERVVAVVQPARRRSNLQWQTTPRTNSGSP